MGFQLDVNEMNQPTSCSLTSELPYPVATQMTPAHQRVLINNIHVVSESKN